MRRLLSSAGRLLVCPRIGIETGDPAHRGGRRRRSTTSVRALGTSRRSRCHRPLFEPAGLAALLSAPVPVRLFQVIMAVMLLANVAFILGWRFQFTGPLFAGLLLWVLCYRNSWSMIYHTDNLLVLQAIVLGLTRSADALSLDARGHQPLGAAASEQAASEPTASTGRVTVHRRSGSRLALGVRLPDHADLRRDGGDVLPVRRRQSRRRDWLGLGYRRRPPQSGRLRWAAQGDDRPGSLPGSRTCCSTIWRSPQSSASARWSSSWALRWHCSTRASAVSGPSPRSRCTGASGRLWGSSSGTT